MLVLGAILQLFLLDCAHLAQFFTFCSKWLTREQYQHFTPLHKSYQNFIHIHFEGPCRKGINFLSDLIWEAVNWVQNIPPLFVGWCLHVHKTPCKSMATRCCMQHHIQNDDDNDIDNNGNISCYFIIMIVKHVQIFLTFWSSTPFVSKKSVVTLHFGTK